MPKVPEYELGRSMDPESEEYSPTMREVEDELQMKESVLRELADINRELTYPTEDSYTGEKSKFRATSPESFWDRLAYLRIDFTDRVKDPELRKELEGKILETEQQIYRQFIPFIESRINIFGQQNSPLRGSELRHRLSADEIISYFNEARSVLKHFKISEEQQVDFLSELDRLEEKFERYRNEPTLFTFEEVEEELQKELYDIRYGDFYLNQREIFRTLDNDQVRVENQKKFELLLAKAHSLIEIASRMLNESIRTHCETRSKSLFEYVEYLKAKSDAPRELLTLEAELKDLFQRIQTGENINAEELDKIGRRLSEIKEKKLGFDYDEVIKNLERLFVRAKRIFAGENVGEDDDLFHAEAVGVDWAWSLLGVERNASEDDVKSAYRKLARKYHPDVSTSQDAEEKMKKINEAYELIKRVQGWN